MEARLKGVLEQWAEFETQLDTHTKWFRVTEVAFRDQQLAATLEQKEQQLAAFRDKRKLIADKEAEIDAFVDKSNALLHTSGADKIKTLISQINNRLVVSCNLLHPVYCIHPGSFPTLALASLSNFLTYQFGMFVLREFKLFIKCI